MSNHKKIEDLKRHLQVAVEVELSTIPIYLYTYYSINRMPSLDSKVMGAEMETFANKAGGVLMSVAVEEMLHLSLASNILRALGGKPKIYDRSPKKYPTNLLDHKSGFSVGLTKLTVDQLEKFKEIEKPAPVEEKPQGDNWETLGQFYEYVAEMVKEHTSDSNYQNPESQLVDGKGYYAPNNVDTVYPKDASYIQKPANPKCPAQRGASQAQYPNADDSGNLKQITCKQDALDAIMEISEQGEGFREDPTHKFDDRAHLEESHWFKYNELHKELSHMVSEKIDLSNFVHNFPDSPKKKDIPEEFHDIVDLSDAVYSYLLWMTEKSFTLEGSAQNSMFYVGMHKGMIFILDKLIGSMRYITYKKDKVQYNLAPTFANYKFKSEKKAKEELVKLATKVASKDYAYDTDGGTPFKLSSQILERIQDLPNVHVVDNMVSFA